jgi:hypothetical protein
MSIDGLMPPNLVNMTAMIRDFSAYGVFAHHSHRDGGLFKSAALRNAAWSVSRREVRPATFRGNGINAEPQSGRSLDSQAADFSVPANCSVC